MWILKRTRRYGSRFIARYGTCIAISLFYIVGCAFYFLNNEECTGSKCREVPTVVRELDAPRLQQSKVPEVPDVPEVPQPCTFGKPCMYPEEVHFRIIVLTYNRPEALSRCLTHLQEVILDGDTARMEIWVDRDHDNNVYNDTLDVAMSFKWTQGQVRVHVQEKHAGVYGQWINTWRPRASSAEIAIYLEDDMITSPFFYRWLKGAHWKYGNMDDICGYSLQEENVKIASRDEKPLDLRRSDELVYLYRVFGTWGFAPHPVKWREFQDWYHEASQQTSFRPYVQRAALQTRWYKQFESEGREQSMWSMWFIYFTDQNTLWTICANINRYTNKRTRALVTNTREGGMHYSYAKVDAARILMTSWDDAYLYFSNYVERYDYDGQLYSDPDEDYD